ncbi:amidase domain-containing protein [Clostridium sardiniense]|uniref:Amidase domain-containing protein n=1 Tax=Clostridium sardiniense TaxID=29369 RepID=A0ABS7L284_CLOSR|nr:amidase domain-containing protein [Clostridium sardiniense]MBY0757193.1 amidase domain-containing protein [Clostridium sardiniense]MDQ0461631.1 hypothetical protein [Clostridium sardiniense]
MKKTNLIKSIAGAMVILMGISSTDLVKADTIQNKKFESIVQVNDVEIQKTLHGYLSNKWEEAKEVKIINNEYIAKDSLQKTYDKLKSQYEHKWREEISEKIEWYKMNININSIDIVNGFIKVDVNNDVTFQYEGVDVTSGIKEHHIIYLKEENGNILVDKDIFDDSLSEIEDIKNIETDFSIDYNFNKYINEKIEKVTSNLKVINDSINQYKSDMKKNIKLSKDNLNSSTRLYPRYNGSKAASWALQHVYDNEVWPGDNCTYFVSSALHAGGLPTDKTWYKDKWCPAWIRVIELRNWLLNKGYAKETVGQAYGNEGDVIQLFNKSKNNWSHSVIVTYTNHRYGNCYVSAHSNKAYNVSVRNYYPSSTYSNARTLRLS